MATLTTAARNAAVNGVTALLNSGTLMFQTSAHVEVAICNLNATAFGAGSNGTATANAISDDTDAAGGVINHAHLRKSDTTEIISLTCSVTGGGGDLQLTSLTIGAGDTVSVTSLTLTQPA
jgi:hypothetical protein